MLLNVAENMLILAQTGTTGVLTGLIPYILLIGGMWFLLIVPQRKKQKQHAQMLQALTSGDNVLTNGGIYGTITNIKEDRFVLKIGDNTRVEVNKSFIQSKVEASKE